MTTPQKRTPRGVVVADTPDRARRFVATRRLKWGEDWIEPGQEIPRDRTGRSMAALVKHGVIAPFVPAGREKP
jgi:hypothetical protein